MLTRDTVGICLSRSWVAGSSLPVLLVMACAASGSDTSTDSTSSSQGSSAESETTTSGGMVIPTTSGPDNAMTTCELVPVCAGDPLCHFRSNVAGLKVQCYRNDLDLNRWYMHIESTGLPDHAYADPSGAVWAQYFSFEIPLETPVDPQAAAKPCPAPHEQLPMNHELFGPQGVAINGVAIYRPLNADYVDPVAPPESHTPARLDYCGGHAESGIYHYHQLAPCLHGVFRNGQPAHGVLNTAPDDPTIKSSWSLGDWPKPSGIIGFSLRGAPIYGPYADALGTPHSGLDACNGKLDAHGNYAYFVTVDQFPYMLGCQGPGVDRSMMVPEDWACTSQPPARATN